MLNGCLWRPGMAKRQNERQSLTIVSLSCAPLRVSLKQKRRSLFESKTPLPCYLARQIERLRAALQAVVDAKAVWRPWTPVCGRYSLGDTE